MYFRILTFFLTHLMVGSYLFVFGVCVKYSNFVMIILIFNLILQKLRLNDTNYIKNCKIIVYLFVYYLAVMWSSLLKFVYLRLPNVWSNLISYNIILWMYICSCFMSTRWLSSFAENIDTRPMCSNHRFVENEEI